MLSPIAPRLVQKSNSSVPTYSVVKNGPLQVDGHLCVLARHVEQEPRRAARRLHVLTVHLDDVEELLEARPERGIRKISILYLLHAIIIINFAGIG